MRAASPPKVSLRETHSTKRPRLILACLRCRSRKIRCGKEQPQCVNCRRSHEPCFYVHSTRNQETGGVIHSTEVDHANQTSDTVTSQSDSSGAKPAEVKETDQSTQTMIQLPRAFHTVYRRPQHWLIESSFWGWVNGQENITQLFQDPHYGQEDRIGLPPPYISSVSLAISLHDIPNKAECDALFEYFIAAVHPVHPVFDINGFSAVYRSFWELFGGTDASCVPLVLIEDPTFICALWAVLFAGASIATETFWETSALKGTDQVEITSRLANACSKSLVACQHTENPTPNTLAASIIYFHFTENTPLQSATFLASSIRLAQIIGLDRGETPDLPESCHGLVWRHLIWLDLQTSLLTGLPPCIWESVSSTYVVGLPVATRTFHQDTVAGVQKWFMHEIRARDTIPVTILARCIELIKSNCEEMNNSISVFPVEGVPEKGVIPFRLARTSPGLDPQSYNIDAWCSTVAKEPSVASTWTRMMLTLLKLELIITCQRMLLPPPDEKSPFSHLSWHGVTTMCLHYLRIFTHLYRTPAFQPYFWFHSKYYHPQQCALFVLIFLKNNPEFESHQKAEMLFCVDEFLNFCTTNIYPKSLGNAQSSREKNLPKSISVLTDLRNDIPSDFQNGLRHSSRGDSTTVSGWNLASHCSGLSKDNALKELFDPDTWLRYFPSVL